MTKTNQQARVQALNYINNLIDDLREEGLTKHRDWRDVFLDGPPTSREAYLVTQELRRCKEKGRQFNDVFESKSIILGYGVEEYTDDEG